MRTTVWTQVSKSIGHGEYGRPIAPDAFPSWQEVTQAGNDALEGDVAGLRKLLTWNRFLSSPPTIEQARVMRHLEGYLLEARVMYQARYVDEVQA